MTSSRTLYIGKNLEVVSTLKANEKHPLVHHTSIINAYQWLKKEKQPPKAILCDFSFFTPKAVSTFERIWGKLESPLPFFLVTENLNQEILRTAWKGKASDIFCAPLDVHRLNRRIEAIKSFKSTPSQHLDEPNHKVPAGKRAFDIIVASTALLISSPVLLIIALLIRLESKGPIFYASKRVGSGYKIFNFYKLRSMYPDADKRLKELEHLNQYKNEDEGSTEQATCPKCEELGQPCSSILYMHDQAICENLYRTKQKSNGTSFIKFKNDPRITRVGKFIRNTSIDELPQLFNVLKGDMSIVGNRPLPLYEAETITSDEWSLRFLAPAGITGLWQVSKRGKGEMSDEERKHLDNQYAVDYSLWGDIKLLLKTIPALFQSEDV